MMMKEKLSLRDLKGLLTLIEEKSIRASALSERIWKTLSAEHLVSVTREGRSYILKTTRPELVRAFAQRITGATDLVSYQKALEDKQAGINPGRSLSSQLTNDSKAFGTDVMKGIRLNTLGPVNVLLEGTPWHIDPVPGACAEIDDQSSLEIDPGIIIVGVENYSTFMRIKDYAYLFDAKETYLFSYRSTFGRDSYGEWIEWLKRVPNRYLHFGDLDKGGIKIYIDSFRSVLGERASFLIPEGYEDLIRNGSTRLYNDQYGQASPDVSKDPRVKPLLDAIEKYHKSCEQEKLARR